MNPILSKISKLLALANNEGATEAEAASAAAKVQELLQDHGLTLSQVEAATTNHVDVKREKRTTDRRAAKSWQRDLMAALAENNFCLHEVVKQRNEVARYSDGTGRYSYSHLLVGRELNVEVTVLTYDYLVSSIQRLAKEQGFLGMTKNLSWFFDGTVSRLIERLNERRRERELESASRSMQTNGSGKELVLSDVYGSEADLNNDAHNGFAPGTTAARRREHQAKQAAQQVEHDRLVAEGMENTEAWYRAYGYGEQTASKMAQAWNTRRGRRGRGRSTNWTQNDREYSRKINSSAYQAGRETGNTISLDSQISETTVRRIGR